MGTLKKNKFLYSTFKNEIPCVKSINWNKNKFFFQNKLFTQSEIFCIQGSYWTKGQEGKKRFLYNYKGMEYYHFLLLGTNIAYRVHVWEGNICCFELLYGNLIQNFHLNINLGLHSDLFFRRRVIIKGQT